MKNFPIAAAALLFGTSAYAALPSTQPTGVQVDKDPYTVTGTSALNSATDVHQLQPAAVDWWGTAEPVADTPVAYAPAAKTSDKSFAAVESGVGGPDAGIDTAAAEFTPRPAAQNYPACRPGRGDDNCIQLYEPGVRQQLASWSQPTGGFADAGETQVAMGGPYEPADSASATERLNQQALADSSAALQAAQMADASAVATHEQALDDSAVESASMDQSDIVTDDEKPVEV